jgi:hypothetical protein
MIWWYEETVVFSLTCSGAQNRRKYVAIYVVGRRRVWPEIREAWCTYRSIRHERYDLERLRHSGSLVPRWDLMHRRYESMISLHSPKIKCQYVVCIYCDDGSGLR